MSVNQLEACRSASSYVCNVLLWSASQFVFIETTPELCKLVGNAELAVNKLKRDQRPKISGSKLSSIIPSQFWNETGQHLLAYVANSTFNLKASVFTSVCAGSPVCGQACVNNTQR